MVKLVSKSIGLLLVGDGLGALIAPKKYLSMLQTGTPMLDDMLDYFVENPQLTQSVSMFEIAIGLWLTLR